MSSGIDPTRTLRGAACGAVAAAVWALQQPLDKRLFGCRYDDVELLGRAFAAEGDWYTTGLFLHVQNGALFGAGYASLAPHLPLRPQLRGPLAGLTEHLALWPLTMATDRFHPARKVLPKLSGSRRAFAQATWRHLLFGVVLGELERRLNPPSPPSSEEPAANFSSNGHGSLEHAASAGPAS